MCLHANSKLGPAGRLALVHSIEGGCSIRAAATSFNVSVATGHRWWHRWRQASEAERRSRSCLLDRSSRPTRSPRRLAPELEQAICQCRRQTGWGPRLVAVATDLAHSTVWKVLKRAGLSRPPRAAKEPANRYEWPCPGDLLHMDVSEYVRFKRPGHRLTGDRRSQDSIPDGIDHVHAIVDDHSRLARRVALSAHHNPDLWGAVQPVEAYIPAALMQHLKASRGGLEHGAYGVWA